MRNLMKLEAEDSEPDRNFLKASSTTLKQTMYPERKKRIITFGE